MVLHGSGGVRFVSLHIKVAGSRQAKQDHLFFTGLLAPEGFVNGHPDCVGGFWRRQNGLKLGKLHRSGKHIGLRYRNCLQVPVVAQLGDNGAHAVIAQAAGVVGGGEESVA